MFAIKLADIRIRINNRYPYLQEQCRDYLCPDEDVAFSVTVTPEEIEKEKQYGNFSDGYCESICAYRQICEQLPRYNVFLMHSSVLEVDGYAYAFTAKSGVGKSTHTRLWLENVPHARVLNGDKPLFRIEEDGRVTAFGTPWNGKEGWGENISAPLAAICFIERSEHNSIKRATEADAVGRLLHQLYLRGSRESVNRQLLLMDALIRAVPYYVLRCNISREAALLSFGTMKKDR